MKRITLIVLTLLILTVALNAANKKISYVRPLVGTDGYGSSKVFWSFIEGTADAVRAHSGHFEMATRRPVIAEVDAPYSFSN